jgi:methyl-accepting chemotaxis protein
MVFGWWLSNEVVSPIERVTILAKSLERGSSTSLPKSTGSAETDQLLQTLHRHSQQTQKLVLLMDKVANGNIDVKLTPLQGSDRLTASFQKLLAKFSESIHAKEDLTNLQDAIGQIKREISTVRNGNLDVEIKSDFFQTKEITETFKYLIEHMNQLIKRLKLDSQNAQISATEVDKTISSLIQQDENQIHEMNQASIILKQVPNLIQKISEDLSGSAKSAKQSIDKAKQGNKIAHQNSNAVSQLRKQMREAARGIQGLNERSQEIAKVAKTVEDLAHRTNMIALNASIQATEIGENGHGFVLVAEEVEKLATRANGTNKQISTLNKSILAEINKVGTSLETTNAEVANLSRFAIETANILGELERYVGQFLNLQENLIAYSKQQSEETDDAFQTFVKAIGETEIGVGNLKDSSIRVENLGNLMRNLQLQVTEYRLAHEETDDQPEDHSNEKDREFSDEEYSVQTIAEQNEESLYEEFASQAFDSQELTSLRPDEELEEPEDLVADFQADEAPYFQTDEAQAQDFYQADEDRVQHFYQADEESEIPSLANSLLDIEQGVSSQSDFSPLELDDEGEDSLDSDTDKFYPDDLDDQELDLNEYSSGELSPVDLTEDVLFREASADDSQIEEMKISYDTSELPPEIDPNTPIPTYEEI